MQSIIRDDISSILEIFFNITNVPIICINSSHELVDSRGIDINLNDFLNSNYILCTMKNYLINSEGIFSIKNLDFSYVMLNKNNISQYYFIIGPYRTNCSDYTLHNLKICNRPKSCMNYIVDLLKNIIDNVSTINKNPPMHSCIRKSIEIIHKEYKENLTIDFLAERFGINKCYFCSIFKENTSMTFSNFLSKFRCEKSKKLLVATDLSLLSIALEVGFSNQSYYTMSFKKFFNMTPIDFRRNN